MYIKELEVKVKDLQTQANMAAAERDQLANIVSRLRAENDNLKHVISAASTPSGSTPLSSTEAVHAEILVAEDVSPHLNESDFTNTPSTALSHQHQLLPNITSHSSSAPIELASTPSLAASHISSTLNFQPFIMPSHNSSTTISNIPSSQSHTTDKVTMSGTEMLQNFTGIDFSLLPSQIMDNGHTPLQSKSLNSTMTATTISTDSLNSADGTFINALVPSETRQLNAFSSNTASDVAEISIFEMLDAVTNNQTSGRSQDGSQNTSSHKKIIIPVCDDRLYQNLYCSMDRASNFSTGGGQQFDPYSLFSNNPKQMRTLIRKLGIEPSIDYSSSFTSEHSSLGEGDSDTDPQTPDHMTHTSTNNFSNKMSFEVPPGWRPCVWPDGAKEDTPEIRQHTFAAAKTLQARARWLRQLRGPPPYHPVVDLIPTILMRDLLIKNEIDMNLDLFALDILSSARCIGDPYIPT
jgi:hypothetical protein